MSTETLTSYSPLYTRFYTDGKLYFVGDPSFPVSRSYSDEKSDKIREGKKSSSSISKKLSGWIVPKSYHRVIFDQHEIHGYYVINTGPRTRMERFGNFSGSVGFTNITFQYDPNLQNRAEIQAMLKIKNSTFNAAVSLGEAAETAEMIGSTAKRLAFALEAIREKNVKKFVKALGVEPKKSFFQDKLNLRNKWLEHRYGWMPLLGDVDNAAKALAESSTNHPPVITGKGTIKTNLPLSYSTDYGQDKVDHNFKITELCYVRLDFLPGNYAVQAIKQLGITNPLEVAWELLPLSFVADWFVPVGDYVSAFDYDVGLEFLSGSCTKRRETVETISAGQKSPDTVWWDISGTKRWFMTHRSIYNDAPFPSIPSPKSPLSFKHMADGLSLLTQVFGGRR